MIGNKVVMLIFVSLCQTTELAKLPYSTTYYVLMSISCPLCSRAIKNRSGLTQHINRVHSGHRRPSSQNATVPDKPPPSMGHGDSCVKENHTVLDGESTCSLI